MRRNLYLAREKEWASKIHYRTSWNIYPQIIKKIRMKSDEKILDAGCGYGELANWIKKGSLTGVDFKDKWVKEARKKNYDKVLKQNIENLKFKDNEFDTVFSLQVFQYLENPKKAFEELKRVTKNQIIITTPNFGWLKLKSLFSKRWRKQYKFCAENENITDTLFLKRLGKNKKLKIKIYYLSNKFGFVRNFFGRFLSSEVMGIYKVK